MVKMLYKPFGLLFSVAGGLVASAIFGRLWKLITGDDEAPKATEQKRTWRAVLIAATAQGAVFGLVKAAIDRGGAAGFRKATGEWPGDD
jgi:Protein of unknown function (DUF4235)